MAVDPSNLIAALQASMAGQGGQTGNRPQPGPHAAPQTAQGHAQGQAGLQGFGDAASVAMPGAAMLQSMIPGQESFSPDPISQLLEALHMQNPLQQAIQPFSGGNGDAQAQMGFQNTPDWLKWSWQGPENPELGGAY